MAAFYIVAGVNHFRAPEFYVAIMPPYLPWHLELVYLSGVAEIVCGVGLLIPRTRVLAAWATIALLIAVFPANIHVALNNVPMAGRSRGPRHLELGAPALPVRADRVGVVVHTRGGLMATYRGGCHCGAVRFEVEGELAGVERLQLLDLHAHRLSPLVRGARALPPAHAARRIRHLRLRHRRREAPLLQDLRHLAVPARALESRRRGRERALRRRRRSRRAPGHALRRAQLGAGVRAARDAAARRALQRESASRASAGARATRADPRRPRAATWRRARG